MKLPKNLSRMRRTFSPMPTSPLRPHACPQPTLILIASATGHPKSASYTLPTTVYDEPRSHMQSATCCINSPTSNAKNASDAAHRTPCPHAVDREPLNSAHNMACTCAAHIKQALPTCSKICKAYQELSEVFLGKKAHLAKRGLNSTIGRWSSSSRTTRITLSRPAHRPATHAAHPDAG